MATAYLEGDVETPVFQLFMRASVCALTTAYSGLSFDPAFYRRYQPMRPDGFAIHHQEWPVCSPSRSGDDGRRFAGHRINKHHINCRSDDIIHSRTVRGEERYYPPGITSPNFQS